MTQDKAAIFNVSVEKFEQLVIEASYQTPILVDLWADWCSPCIVIAPILEKLVQESEGKLRLAKVEVDDGDNMKIAGRYKARGFPTIILFHEGEEKGRFAGAKPLSFVQQFIDQHLT